MCNRLDCVNNMGKWIRFSTPWGQHRGVVTDVNRQAVLVRVPRQYAPTGLASAEKSADAEDVNKIDAALAAWGYGPGYGAGYGYGGPGYGGGYGYGGGWGRPGYGAWYGGWWWWWLAFAWIFALAFLW